MKRVYLDNAATTPIAPEIIEMMSEIMKTNFANPSSLHSFGRESKIIVENARKNELVNAIRSFGNTLRYSDAVNLACHEIRGRLSKRS